MTSLQFSRAFCVTTPNPLRVLSDLCVSSLQFLSGLSVSILKSKLLPPTQPLTNKRGVLSGLCVSNP
jgi:hypothetical protein